ncbi:hypothetical protein DERF_014882 [Dermatophagoides farinae]|uniref:Uncharacterized protein n=1 Tax=Dermatophagoides farinae TaxID=6954 RepID=A0A922KV92_DERFA|nr:hypothetical protein DERF_014882 [Dermatophagoides farinae]
MNHFATSELSNTAIYPYTIKHLYYLLPISSSIFCYFVRQMAISMLNNCIGSQQMVNTPIIVMRIFNIYDFDSHVHKNKG